MDTVVILVPIYKRDLSALETYSLDKSLSVLEGRRVMFIGPQGLDRKNYTTRYPFIPFIEFPSVYFESIPGYSRLLLSPAFYLYFSDFEFVLILQTDAIVLKDEIDYWCAQPFDYIGAPWPDGYEIFINAGKFRGDYGKRVKVFVGNGGFSLRRVSKSISLLNEFSNEIVDFFMLSGSSEDLFFSVMGALSNDFIIPNEIIASRFSMELKPSLYLTINGGHLPMGGHAWWKYEPDFWRQQFAEQLSALPEEWLNHE